MCRSEEEAMIKLGKSADGSFYLAIGKSFINQYSGFFSLEEKSRRGLSVHDLILTAMGGMEEQMTAEEFYIKRL